MKDELKRKSVIDERMAKRLIGIGIAGAGAMVAIAKGENAVAHAIEKMTV